METPFISASRLGPTAVDGNVKFIARPKITGKDLRIMESS
jgi:hypothetical protein